MPSRAIGCCPNICATRSDPMKAVSYTGFGAAADVLDYGDLPDPEPGPGEVLVALKASGVNPSDAKLRAGARPGATMAFPRIIPHSDGAGEIVAVGQGCDPSRIGERVWIWNGQWQRAHGSAAELIALPAAQAVPLPEGTSFAEGACLGIPAMTAWYNLLGDGPIAGQTVLVTGGAGAVGRYACQMARLAGARVITTVSSAEKAAHAGAEDWINYREADVTEAVMEMTGGAGVDRIVEVDFGANQDTSLKILKPRGVIATYASAAVMEPTLQFYPLMFLNIRLQMSVVYRLDPETHARGAAQLTEWLADGLLSHAVIEAGGLQDAASAHDLVTSGDKLGCVTLRI